MGLKSDHDMLVEIHTALFGPNGNTEEGLCSRYRKLSVDYYNFKRWVIGILIAAVVSGGGSIGLINLLK